MTMDRTQICLIFIFGVLLVVTASTGSENGEQLDNPTSKTTNTEKPGVTSTQNSTQSPGNETKSSDSGLGGILHKLQDNKGMLLRTFYVLMGVTTIVVVYFVVRAWRSRRRSKSRKYGLITASGNDLEMEPLDQDVDDDEDMTVFEMNNRRARK